jgi:hypothetical protein
MYIYINKYIYIYIWNVLDFSYHSSIPLIKHQIMRRARWPAMESQVAKPTCPGIWGWHSVSTGSEWPQKIAKSSLFLNHSIYISIYFYHLMAIVFYAPTYQTRKKMVPKFPKVPVRMILNDRDMIGLNSPDVGIFFFFRMCSTGTPLEPALAQSWKTRRGIAQCRSRGCPGLAWEHLGSFNIFWVKIGWIV